MAWDQRYRQLQKDEIILETDEIMKDDGTWKKDAGMCAGTPAPDPSFTSHRWYRRLKDRAS